MVSPGDCDPGGQENSGVKQGDPKGVQGRDACGGSAAPDLGGGGKARVEEGSEKAQEKENLRSDEQDYSKPKAFLHWGCVVTLEGTLPDNVSPSLVHC